MTDFRVFVNFKTYSQGTAEAALNLAQICSAFAEASADKGEIIPIVQAVDLYRITQVVKIPVWVQHVDPQPPGQFTGWTNLEAVIAAGANGTLINHSEHQIPPGTIKQTISRIENCKLKIENFGSMICCRTLGQMERLIKLKPDYIGYEISELIGGEISVTDSDPRTIKHAVEICGKIPLIVGAGIHKPEDLAKARELGARGVLISSAVVLAEDPKEKLNELIFSA